ncbi:hypothetical protein Taro_045857 [Colocasia esculenta]|uniref:6-phosphogluconate dehydrogenase NADP-binding domain-containing protein n=1 Tax=Colocasia esculenta TaxID=4460 RepID=A0A843WXL2_COLES|nr:hypothetical protein [Colocasia esculenta]
MASPRVVGFVGLDELSVEMAALLVKSGFQVKAFAAAECAWLTPFLEVGGSQCHNIEESGKDVTALIVTSTDQVDDELFCGNQGITKWLCEDAAVIIRSTIPLRYIQKLEKHLNGEGNKVIVGVHVFKGMSDALEGKLMVTAVGHLEDTKKAEPLLAESGRVAGSAPADPDPESGQSRPESGRVGLSRDSGLCKPVLWVGRCPPPESGRQGPTRLRVGRLRSESADFAIHDSNRFFPHFSTCLMHKGAVMDVAKELTFPLPLLAIARQQLIRGYSCKVGDHASDELVEVWEKYFGVNIRDVYEPSMSRFTKAGGLVGHSPAEVSRDVDVLIVMVANEAQAESVLFGDGGSVSALPVGSSIILSSTVSPGYVTRLEQRLKGENKNLKLVDAPVSGGVKRAADGTLTIMASGTTEALEHAGSVLSALSEKLYIINGGCGAASSVKMVNQLLAGVHIAAASEAMAFGAKNQNISVFFYVLYNLSLLDHHNFPSK